MVLIDEADVIDNKTYKTVIQHLYNSRIRVGLSGTIYMSNQKKKLIHNLNIMSFIGDKVNQIKLSDMIEKGILPLLLASWYMLPLSTLKMWITQQNTRK